MTGSYYPANATSAPSLLCFKFVIVGWFIWPLKKPIKRLVFMLEHGRDGKHSPLFWYGAIDRRKKRSIYRARLVQLRACGSGFRTVAGRSRRSYSCSSTGPSSIQFIFDFDSGAVFKMIIRYNSYRSRWGSY